MCSQLLKKILVGILASLWYVVFFFAIRFVLKFLPDLQLWKKSDFFFVVQQYRVPVIDLIYFILGVIFIVHAAVKLHDITVQNHKAQDMETRKPMFLLTDENYGKVRHPMYGNFMLIQLAVFFPTRTLYGVIVVIVVVLSQFVNGVIEEKNQLLKLFGEKYIEYQNKVKARYLTPVMKFYFFIAVCMTIVGFFC